MILEGAQLLASAIHVIDPKLAQAQVESNSLYRLTHKNHPCAIWVRSSVEHYIYLLDLMTALNEEAKWRYDRSNDHLSLLKAQEWEVPVLPFTTFVEPPKCVHDDFKQMPDTVEAYREYYKRDKRDIAKWTKRSPPVWW